MKKDKNYTQELVEYVKRNLKKGYTKESLKWALINQGHSKIEIERAIKSVDKDLASEAPVLKTKPTITYEVISASDEEEKKSFWKRLFG